ncbi:MAG TPA: AbrB family transcriptional regulator [Casimicrobiaceae bacterium]|jgi:hypothetical protein|nr:AbrB family transcriptional regulator [Casimicrobiaceae bacterium]
MKPSREKTKADLDDGDRLEFVEHALDEFALNPATEDVRSLKGMIRRPARPVSNRAMNAAIKRGRFGR